MIKHRWIGALFALAALGQSLAAQAYPKIASPDNVLLGYKGQFRGDKVMPFGEILYYNSSDLTYLRNEIFAKYGRPFDTPDIRSYFGNLPWYIENPRFVDSMLTPADAENVNRIVKVQSSMGKAELELLAKLETGAIFTMGPAEAPIDDISSPDSDWILLDSAVFKIADVSSGKAEIKLVTRASEDARPPLFGTDEWKQQLGSLGPKSNVTGLWFINNGRLYLVLGFEMQTGMFTSSLFHRAISFTYNLARQGLSDPRIESAGKGR